MKDSISSKTVTDNEQEICRMSKGLFGVLSEKFMNTKEWDR